MKSFSNNPINQFTPDSPALQLLANTDAAEQRAALEVFKLGHPDSHAIQLSHPETGKVHGRIGELEGPRQLENGCMIRGMRSSDVEARPGNRLT